MSRGLVAAWVGLVALGCSSDGAEVEESEPMRVAVDELPPDAAVSTLTLEEASALCSWFESRLAMSPCASTNASLDFDCQRAATCSARVGDVRACADARAMACDVASPSACGPVAASCGDGETPYSEPPAPPPICQEGTQEPCVCRDGRSGNRSCANEAWSACDCGPVCTPGYLKPCTCDGLGGYQTCFSDGRGWGPCECEKPEPPPACDPDRCPDPGLGVPCCITSDGPCGLDIGIGCDLCVFGEALPCTCPDGSQGGAMCIGDGEWEPCSCGG